MAIEYEADAALLLKYRLLKTEFKTYGHIAKKDSKSCKRHKTSNRRWT